MFIDLKPGKQQLSTIVCTHNYMFALPVIRRKEPFPT
jgi:hypothetical protein